MVTRSVLQFAFLFFVLLALVSCSTHTETHTIKLAHGLDITHPVHKAMEFMAKDLHSRSKGKMAIRIYPNQQLGSERQCLELLQIGSLGMTKVSASVMENFSPSMKVFGVPFLFKNRGHTFKVVDSEIGKELLDGGEAYRLKGLGFYDSGSRSFYTKESPINTPEDLTGLKIRVQESITAMDMVRGLGGSPTPISWGELYTSLQQGVVDGAENNPPSFYLSRHYEVCKYYSLDEHTTIPDIIIIGTYLWDNLNDREKEWLQAAVDASVTYQRKLWAQAEKEALDEIQKAGVTVTRPDKSAFFNQVADQVKVYEQDPVLADLIERIQAID